MKAFKTGWGVIQRDRKGGGRENLSGIFSCDENNSMNKPEGGYKYLKPGCKEADCVILTVEKLQGMGRESAGGRRS